MYDTRSKDTVSVLFQYSTSVSSYFTVPVLVYATLMRSILCNPTSQRGHLCAKLLVAVENFAFEIINNLITSLGSEGLILNSAENGRPKCQDWL